MHLIEKDFKKNPQMYGLIAILLIYILIPIQTPSPLAGLIDSLGGRLVFIGLAFALLFHHKIAGALALFAVYELFHRSEKTTGSYHMRRYLPSESTKVKQIKPMNHFPVTLEEEVIKNQVPIQKTEYSKPSFKPVLDKLHGATQV